MLIYTIAVCNTNNNANNANIHNNNNNNNNNTNDIHNNSNTKNVHYYHYVMFSSARAGSAKRVASNTSRRRDIGYTFRLDYALSI